MAVWLLSIALSILAGGAAHAAPSCQDDAVCRAEFKRASELYLQKQYAEALEAFRAAYARRAEPRILLNIGRTLHKLERPEEALTEYQRCWNTAAPDDRDLLQTLEQYMREARALHAQQQATAAAAAPKAQPLPAPEQPPATAQESPKPVYKKAWFWGLIGGVVVAGVVVGAVAGTQARASGPEPLPYHIAF